MFVFFLLAVAALLFVLAPALLPLGQTRAAASTPQDAAREGPAAQEEARQDVVGRGVQVGRPRAPRP